MHKRASPRSQSPAPSRAHVPSPASSTVRVPTLPQESVKSGSETGTDPIPSTLQEPRQPMIPTIASRTDESASVSDPAVLDRAPPPPQKPAHEPDPKTPADPTPPPPHEPEAPTPETSDKSVPDAASLISPDNNIPLGSTTAIVKGRSKRYQSPAPPPPRTPSRQQHFRSPPPPEASARGVVRGRGDVADTRRGPQRLEVRRLGAVGRDDREEEEGVTEQQVDDDGGDNGVETGARQGETAVPVGRWGKGRRKAAGEKRASARQRGCRRRRRHVVATEAGRTRSRPVAVPRLLLDRRRPATATPPPKQPENGRASKPKRSAERPRKTVRSSPAGSHSSLGRPSPVSSMLMMATAMPTFSA
ncbi:hypothetical protein H2203_001059 [Taxawa tesnikishii (nom. ined.)]|nr:hypothetical protein H2203_001059 [Dothideales sp. JES 119]